ncbi:MAG: hypothetical protein ABW277_07240 [Longimicrobiaceae bacterium]
MSLGQAAFVLCVAAWLAFCAWTARRLLSGAGGARRAGVLGWGVPVWLMWSVSMAYYRADGALLSSAGLRELCVALVAGFPLFLWAGHFMGVFMARASRRPSVRRPGRGDAG